MWLFSIALWMTHPLVVVEGEGSCPAAADVEARVAVLIPPVEESEPQHRAVIARSADGLAIELLRDDNERLANRRLPATGSCAELAGAAAVVIAAWEARFKVEAASRVRLPAADRPAAVAETTGAGAVAAPSRLRLEGRLGVIASLASGDITPGATIEGSLLGGGDRFGGALGLSATGWHAASLADAGGAGARWMRGALTIGPQVRLHAPARLAVDLHVDALLGWLRVEGSEPSAGGAAWSARSDSTVQLGAGGGVRVTRGWGPFALWIGVLLRAWPGQQQLVVEGQPASHGEIPAFEGETALGVGWRSFP